MATKLTLSVDEDIIAKAKVFAKEKHTSLSKMVEDYLKTLLKSKDDKVKSKASILDELVGILKDPGPDWDPDQARYEYLKKRYDL